MTGTAHHPRGPEAEAVAVSVTTAGRTIALVPRTAMAQGTAILTAPPEAMPTRETTGGDARHLAGLEGRQAPLQGDQAVIPGRQAQGEAVIVTRRIGTSECLRQGPGWEVTSTARLVRTMALAGSTKCPRSLRLRYDLRLPF